MCNIFRTEPKTTRVGLLRSWGKAANLESYRLILSHTKSKIIDEIVGKDEEYPETSMFSDDYQDEWNKCLARNELRAELRQKLDKLLK